MTKTPSSEQQLVKATHTAVGHRQRLKERFMAEGLDNFDEVHVLELLLFYAIPRKDTKPLARTLLDHFGSLAQVLEATHQELCKVPGVTPNAASLLCLTTELGRYYLVNRITKHEILNTTEKCGAYLVPRFFGRTQETVLLLCLDAKCKMLCCREVGQGSVNSAGVSIRRIVETALSVNASSVVLAHNHPSGLAIPSGEDVITTRKVAAALATVQIILADHLVIADDDFVSLVQSGLYKPGET